MTGGSTGAAVGVLRWLVGIGALTMPEPVGGAEAAIMTFTALPHIRSAKEGHHEAPAGPFLRLDVSTGDRFAPFSLGVCPR